MEKYNKRNSFGRKRNSHLHSTINLQSSTLNHPPRQLASLASEEQKSRANIQLLTYDFACRIVRLFQYLTENQKEYILSKQILRSGTSIGANVREAHNAQSSADFISKMSIASKEADETEYWLLLLHDNGYINRPQFESMHTDCIRVIKVVVSIIKTMKTKTAK